MVSCNPDYACPTPEAERLLVTAGAGRTDANGRPTARSLHGDDRRCGRGHDLCRGAFGLPTGTDQSICRRWPSALVVSPGKDARVGQARIDSNSVRPARTSRSATEPEAQSLTAR